MGLTFLSKSLDRTVDLDGLSSLPLSDVRALHAELVVAVQSMDDSVNEALKMQELSGISADQDWVHRVRKKRRICVAFAAQAKQLLDTKSSDSTFQGAYAQHLDALVLKELGAAVYGDIKDEARELALADLQAGTPAA
jgi:hypothetical protein